MGMYERQYLGIYIELEYKQEPGGWVTIRVCPNGHDQNIGDSFCGDCGAEIVDENTKPIVFVTIYDLIDKELIPIGDADDFSIIEMDSSKKTWLVQNLTKGKYGIFLEDADYGAYTMSLKSDNVIKEFKEEFAELLKQLEIHCKKVKVDYGLIKYYN